MATLSPSSLSTSSRPSISIDTAHSRIHEGKLYETSNIDTAIGAATTTYYLLRTPNTTTRIHLVINVISTLGLTIRFYEGATINVDGTPVTTINHNRTSSNTATLQVFSSPTVGANGTQIYAEETGSGTASGGKSVTIDNGRNETEWILAQNTNYLLSHTTSAAASTDVTTIFRWYEI